MMVHRSARLARALVALVVIGSGSWIGTQAQPPAAPPAGLASPEQFFGHKMGADRKLANWDKLLSMLPDPREICVQHAARRIRKEQREPSLRRHLRLVARQSREARSVPSVEREAG